MARRRFNGLGPGRTGYGLANLHERANTTEGIRASVILNSTNADVTASSIASSMGMKPGLFIMNHENKKRSEHALRPTCYLPQPDDTYCPGTPKGESLSTDLSFFSSFFERVTMIASVEI